MTARSGRLATRSGSATGSTRRVLSMILAWLSLAGVAAAMQTSDTAYDWPEALEKGALDLSSDRWSGRDRGALIAHLAELDPGIVNRFAFFFGGASEQDLAATAAVAAKVHQAVPRAIMGATLPELIRADYAVALTCGGKATSFVAGDITGQASGDYRWLDMSRPAAAAYYECLGERYLGMGFSLIHFENSGTVIRNSANHAQALAAYVQVAAELRRRAGEQGRPLYLSGDFTTAAALKLEAVYEPSRFYHMEPGYKRYQNRVPRPGHGNGYSYVLSLAIIEDQKAKLPATTAVLFYVDNWNDKEDDLRRMMELDADNRRFMIAQSLVVARQHGALFVPSLDHCVGCVAPRLVGDPCEILLDGRSQYDALTCGDIHTLRQNLHAKPAPER